MANEVNEKEKVKVNCKDCRCFVNYCRKYKKYTDNCESFINDKKDSK